jgi:hypothetical protein
MIPVELISSRSEKAVDRNGRRLFRKDYFVKGAKRRLQRCGRRPLTK